MRSLSSKPRPTYLRATETTSLRLCRTSSSQAASSPSQMGAESAASSLRLRILCRPARDRYRLITSDFPPLSLLITYAARSWERGKPPPCTAVIQFRSAFASAPASEGGSVAVGSPVWAGSLVTMSTGTGSLADDSKPSWPTRHRIGPIWCADASSLRAASEDSFFGLQTRFFQLE